jgi:hypothetical protein
MKHWIDFKAKELEPRLCREIELDLIQDLEIVGNANLESATAVKTR